MPSWAVIPPRRCTAIVTRRSIDRLSTLAPQRCHSNGSVTTSHIAGAPWRRKSSPIPNQHARHLDIFPGQRSTSIAGINHSISKNNRTFNRRLLSTQISVSPSVVNARPTIASQNRDLYKELVGLNSGAAERFCNKSRLELALRGLEGSNEDAVIRVAVLGLNGQKSAGRLARLLLADPLGEKESWEDALEKDIEGPVLLKFGEEADVGPENPLYKTMFVRSRVLQKYNLEVLVSSLNSDITEAPVPATLESARDAVLVPKLQVSATSGVPVPFPVHKTLVLGEGVEDAVSFGRFASTGFGGADELVKVAINLPPPAEEVEPVQQSSTSAVNLKVASDALATFRESIANSSKYEHGWFRSGLPSLSHWLIQDLQPTESIKPVIKTLITSITEDIETSITAEDAQQVAKLAATSTPSQISDSMRSHLATWAEQSHTELRDQLDEAFATRNWHKLSWWKLFWRVDDVGMIASEIIERRWLVDSEKSAVYLAGRMNQAGFPEAVTHTIVNDSDPTNLESTPTTNSSRPTSSMPSLSLSTDIHTPQPWPTSIPNARIALLQTSIPPLQAMAQRLVLTTLSTTSLSSALATLLYVSSASTSVFEAGAVASLGFVLSLRHMQKMWEGARRAWESRVREDGRTTLKSTEEGVSAVIQGGGIVGGVHEDNERKAERKEVRERVRRVHASLKI